MKSAGVPPGGCEAAASKGVVQVKHGSGTYVASTMPLQEDPLGLRFVEDKLQLALDLTDVRMMLEPNIAEMAALNRTDEEAALLVEYSADVRRRIEVGEEYMTRIWLSTPTLPSALTTWYSSP